MDVATAAPESTTGATSLGNPKLGGISNTRAYLCDRVWVRGAAVAQCDLTCQPLLSHLIRFAHTRPPTQTQTVHRRTTTSTPRSVVVDEAQNRSRR
jgi:hypothetical protein